MKNNPVLTRCFNFIHLCLCIQHVVYAITNLHDMIHLNISFLVSRNKFIWFNFNKHIRTYGQGIGLISQNNKHSFSILATCYTYLGWLAGLAWHISGWWDINKIFCHTRCVFLLNRAFGFISCCFCWSLVPQIQVNPRNLMRKWVEGSCLTAVNIKTMQ